MIEKHLATVTVALDGDRFDVAAVALFPALSRKKIKGIIDNGGAYLNKKRVGIAKNTVKQGDKLELYFEVVSEAVTDGPQLKFKKSGGIVTFSAADILHSEADFLVVNKPAGLASQATLTSSHDCILNAVSLANPQEYPLKNLFLVHRLDKETSGLLIIARNKKTQSFFEEQFRDRKINKVYHALCLGQLKEKLGKVSFAIGKVQGGANQYYPVMQSGKGPRDAKSAETDYRVIAEHMNNQVSLVACYPKTGRTHQIRVHLMALGCPILGDKTYARNVLGHPAAQMALRHMLHAISVSFTDWNGVIREFNAPLPLDFSNLLSAIS